MSPVLTYAVSRMKELLLTLLHLAVMTAKLCARVAHERSSRKSYSGSNWSSCALARTRPS